MYLEEYRVANRHIEDIQAILNQVLDDTAHVDEDEVAVALEKLNELDVILTLSPLTKRETKSNTTGSMIDLMESSELSADTIERMDKAAALLGLSLSDYVISVATKDSMSVLYLDSRSVLNIDSKSKQINVNLPEGLLEVYFSSDSSDEDGNGGSF